MRTLLFKLVLFLVVLGHTAKAGVLESFDRLFQGDDPTESFSYVLPHDASMPGWLRFDGFAENLAPDDTGVRFLMRWGGSSTSYDGEFYHPGETEFRGVLLPGKDLLSGTTRVPLHFGLPLDYTPGAVLFVVEGLGPSDYFRFTGELTWQPVPEPATWVLLALCGLLLIARRTAVNAPRAWSRLRHVPRTQHGLARFRLPLPISLWADL